MTVIKTAKNAPATPKKEEKFVLICIDSCGDMCEDSYTAHSFKTEAQAICHMNDEDPDESMECIICKVISEHEAASKYVEVKRYG